MTIEHTPPEWEDQDVTRGLRSLYAPPADASYWHALEARIMSRVAGAVSTEWWSFYGRWTRLGLAAAGIAAIVSGALIAHARDVQTRIAYEAIFEQPVETQAVMQVAETRSATAREATLRYLISY